MGISAGEYAMSTASTATGICSPSNAETASVTYDPRRLQGVTVYREAERELSVGDRVQFTAPDKDDISPTASWVPSRTSTSVAMRKSNWTRAARSVRWASIRISITAMPSLATAARAHGPPAC